MVTMTCLFVRNLMVIANWDEQYLSSLNTTSKDPELESDDEQFDSEPPPSKSRDTRKQYLSLKM